MRRTILSLPVFAFVIAASSAHALPPLEQNPRVAREFLAVSVGDAIRKNCGSISPRLFRVLSKKNALEDYVLSLGYTQSDIDAMVDDKSAKARLKERRNAYLAQNGVKDGNAETYCRLGREEISKNTLTGWLLRAR